MPDTAKKLIPLHDLAEVRAGFPFRGAVDDLPVGAVRVVQVRDVSGSVQIDWAATPLKALPKSRSADFLRAGDVLITTRGRRNEATVVLDPPVQAVAATNLFVIRLCEGVPLLPQFLAWQINQRPAQEYLAASATGSHVLNLTRPALEALPIAVPPLRTQQLAVEFFECTAAEAMALKQLIASRQQQIDAMALKILTGKISA
jgi:restriction endonuclease S subunit